MRWLEPRLGLPRFLAGPLIIVIAMLTGAAITVIAILGDLFR